MGWNSQGAQLRHVVETGDRNAANVVVVQRAGNRETQIKVIPTFYIRAPGLHLDSSGYSQNLQRPQSSERPLLYTADVVFIQLTGEKKNTTQQPVKYLKELHDTVIWLCSQFACVVLLPLISSFLYFSFTALCVCMLLCILSHTGFWGPWLLWRLVLGRPGWNFHSGPWKTRKQRETGSYNWDISFIGCFLFNLFTNLVCALVNTYILCRGDGTTYTTGVGQNISFHVLAKHSRS